MPKKVTFLFVLAAAALIVFYFYNKYRNAPSIKFAELELTDSEGRAFDFNSLKGKKLVLNFYASWCGDCVKELKELNSVQSELEDITVVCITDEPLEKLIAFKNKKQYPFMFLKMQKNFNEIGIHSIPVTYLLNPDFKVLKEQVGYIAWNDPSTLNHLKSLY